jgi:hypothetical protein
VRPYGHPITHREKTTQDGPHRRFTHIALIERYLHLTRKVMPALARTTQRHWPVGNDHCFQRIVLDTIFGGVWYDHMKRPAYQHLGEAEAMRAVQLCEQIISGETDLNRLNRQSLTWRGKARPDHAG